MLSKNFGAGGLDLLEDKFPGSLLETDNYEKYQDERFEAGTSRIQV
jgi:hypothetical protein